MSLMFHNTYCKFPMGVNSSYQSHHEPRMNYRLTQLEEHRKESSSFECCENSTLSLFPYRMHHFLQKDNHSPYGVLQS